MIGGHLLHVKVGGIRPVGQDILLVVRIADEHSVTTAMASAPIGMLDWPTDRPVVFGVDVESYAQH